MKTSTPVPLWILIVASLISLLGMFVGCSLYMSPGTFMPEIDFSLPGMRYLTEMWAARQIAIACIIAYAVWKRSIPMLRISLLAYSIMNLQDLVIGFSKEDYGLAGGASFFFLLPLIMIIVLARKQRQEAAGRIIS